MSTISIRLNDSEDKLLTSYVESRNLNLSKFIREAVFERINDDLRTDEDRILEAWKASKSEPQYLSTDVWKELGI